MTREDIIIFLRQFKDKHAEKYGIISLGIFGSAARNQIRKNSDIDIYVKTRTPDPFILVHLKNDIEKSLERRVDIVRIREQMSPYLKKCIDKEGINV